jgi:cellulose synthase/poly-beta-1,6-N-acetylglucosamine synthase-like glycosyltransferase
MYQQLRVAVVIPAFNEERAIARVVAEVPGYVDHVIVVDDASGDGTAAAARAAVAERTGGEVVVHDVNRGVGGAIVTGYRRALALGVDAVAVMAGDGQMDPPICRRCSTRSPPASPTTSRATASVTPRCGPRCRRRGSSATWCCRPRPR